MWISSLSRNFERMEPSRDNVSYLFDDVPLLCGSYQLIWMATALHEKGGSDHA